MLPTLLQIGPLRISTFGFFIVLGFLLAAFLIWREARREYLDEEKVFDVFLLAVFFGAVGARASFILLFPGKFGFNILRMILPSWMPGFYIYGGLLAGFFVVYSLSKVKELEFGKLLDILLPGFLIWSIFYKIGQFFDGSLIGLETKSFIGLASAGEVGRFVPVAVIEGLAFLLVFAFVVKVKNYFLVKRKVFGGLFLAGLALASLAQTGTFFLVRDKVYFSFIPVSLLLAVFSFICSLIVLYKNTRSLKNDIKLLSKLVIR